jgi:thiamine-monophosphate kinase
MAAEAGVAIVLEHDALPMGEDVLAGAGSPEEARHAVLTGGEDYELLFCCEASEAAVRRALADAGCTTPAHRVGRVEAGKGVWIEQGGERHPWTSSGFEHF